MTAKPTIQKFSYNEHRTHQDGRQTVHRMWVGEYADPEDTIGFIVGEGYQDDYWSADIAIPKQSIPHLIRYLQQFVKETQQ